MAVNIRILGEFDNKGFKQAESALNNLSRVAGAALGALAVGAATAAVASIREFANFDAALTKSLAIMGDVSDTMRGEMSDAARAVAKTTTFSAEQAAESFFFLASAGLDAEASIKALPQVAAFAQAGMFDMARATDLLTDAQSALGLSIKDDAVANMQNMVRVSDVLVKANVLANASVEQFSTSLTTKAGAALKALGKDLEEGVAVLAAFADQGIKGEIAGTQLAIVLRDLTTRGIKNKAAFEQFGVAVFDANGNMNNLADIVGDLEGALDGMSDETQKATLLQMGFSDKSLASLQALLGTSEAIRGYEAELRSAGGITEEVAEKQLDTLNSQLELLKSEFIDVALSVGEQMTPAVRDLVDRVKEMLPILGERLVAALSKIDFARVAEQAADFFVKIVENIDTIIDVTKQLALAAVGIIAFNTALKLATTAQTVFNAIAMKNPYVIIALAALAAGTAIAAAVIQTNAQNRELENQARATGRTVEGQKVYNRELETYLRMQENNRREIGNGTMAVQEFTRSTSGLIQELNRAEDVRLGRLVGELKSVENAAVQARWALSLANEESRLLARAGGQTVQTETVTDPFASFTGGGGRSAAQQAAEKLEQDKKTLGNSISGLRNTFMGMSALSARPLGQLEQAVKNTFGRVGDTIAQAVDMGVITERGGRALQRLADTTERIQTRIAQARQKLADEFAEQTAKLSAARQIRETTAASIAQLANLRDLGDSAGDIITNLGDLVTRTKAFRVQLEQLRALGLDSNLYQQIVNSGLEAGSATAKAIIEGGPTAVAEVNSLFGELQTVGEQIGQDLSEVMYDGGEAAIQGFIDGIIAQDQALLDQAVAAGTVFFDAFEAKINDPSLNLDDALATLRSMEEQFKETGSLLGVAMGNAFKAAFNSIVGSVGTPSTGGGGGTSSGGTSGPNVNVTLPSTPTPIVPVVPEIVAPRIDSSQRAEDLRFDRLRPTTNIINVNVTANDRLGGAKAGEALVSSINKYTQQNGPVRTTLLSSGRGGL
jgi:TP901 family phage tail tape measure protein